MHSYLGPERLRLDTMAGSHSSMESTQIPLKRPSGEHKASCLAGPATKSPFPRLFLWTA